MASAFSPVAVKTAGMRFSGTRQILSPQVLALVRNCLLHNQRIARPIARTQISPMFRVGRRRFWVSAAKGDDFEKEFVQNQKATSSLISKSKLEKGGDDNEECKHIKHQENMFNEMASFYSSNRATPEDVVPILEDMSHKMISRVMDLRAKERAQNDASLPARTNSTSEGDSNVYRILDVGCGSGVLFDFFLKVAAEKGITIHIHGLDLSPKMVEQGRVRGEKLLSEFGNDHSILVEVGDICNWNGMPESDGELSRAYDLVVANACFGNFFDQMRGLEQMSSRLRIGGLLCITHPLGSQFVRKLHEQDPTTVPHLLPTLPDFHKLARMLPLQGLEVMDRQDNPKNVSSSYYIASAVKSAHRPLPEIIRLRGSVDSGYGRGGKKLGFPTANLPSGLFQCALEDVPCGVYFGWATLEDSSKTKNGRNMPHKAVVNVGYSPTFEGQENKEKIVEAFLMFGKGEGGDAEKTDVLDPPDFYGEVMRLQLLGFIRPEMKFPSFPALISQIATDVKDARNALDLEIYQSFKRDSFVSGTEKFWIGQGGGDQEASWEFEDFK